ncbi:hypothetical protein B9Z55_017521 [Caenorhabditis nigoni]|nr:hypothetical protein B9Z55_017521 [Caenorhabditis nigoni]
MGSAKWYLLNLHITCILLDWAMTVLAVPYLIFPALGGYPLGVLRFWFGVPSIVQLYVVMNLAFFAVTSVTLIFENRFYQLYARNSFWRYLRIPFIIINYLLDATHLLPACLMVPDQKTALEFTYEQIPNLSDEIKAEPLFILAIDFWVQMPYISMGLRNVVQVCLFGLINRNMNLESRSFNRSENTINLQRKFLNAIKAQLMVLAINFLVPQAYTVVSIATNYYNQFANNLVITIVALHGINSTLIMLWAHKTYREYCFKTFKKIRSFLGYTTPVSTVSIQPKASITI